MPYLLFLLALAACRARRPSTGDADTGAAPPAAAEAPAEAAADTAVAAALAVLRGYYAALNAREYARAYDAWGDDGPPGRPTRAAFAAGFAATDSAHVVLGTPGRVEGAAGSRYLSVPVTVHAFERGGREVEYEGTYTLRRTVVPGAGAAARRWHLYRGTLRARAAT
jgi:hypothetical protein